MKELLAEIAQDLREFLEDETRIAAFLRKLADEFDKEASMSLEDKLARLEAGKKTASDELHKFVDSLLETALVKGEETLKAEEVKKQIKKAHADFKASPFGPLFEKSGYFSSR